MSNDKGDFAWTTRTTLAGSVLGIWALRLARKRNNSGELSTPRHTQGVIVAGAADLSFVAAGVTFTISMIKRQINKKKEASEEAAQATSLPDSEPSSTPASAPAENTP